MLELTANGARVLHALGMKQKLTEIALTPAFATVRSAANGFLLTQRPLGAFSEARYGAPCYLIEAGALKRMLRDFCRAIDIELQCDAHIVDLETESATLKLADGRQYQHLAAAVAAGSGLLETGLLEKDPGLADLLEKRVWQSDTRPTVIRGRAPRSKQIRDHDRFINTWLFPGGYCVERPLPIQPDGSQVVELIVVTAADRPEDPARTVLTNALKASHPSLEQLALEVIEAEYLQHRSAPPAGYWHAGRTVMLGSVCHVPPVHSDYAPSAAMEDAWVLSRMMERWDDEPHRGFAEYELFRKPRARRLRTHADETLAIHTLSRPAAIWQRNLSWSLTSRFLPEVTMAKLDWLYGYDCIKGFA